MAKRLSQGEQEGGESEADARGAGESISGPKQRRIKAVYVADVDYMHPFFSENRKRPEQFEETWTCVCRTSRSC
jgi:hypothetical protein